ncbi:MAG: PSD1 and planctomycete cytochrome C domain-containing protein [Candidatus Hydrogenedentota bacterium]
MTSLVDTYAQQPRADAVAMQYFNDHVQDVLVNRCLECHAEKREGELDLTNRAGALKGSENGVILIPGDPDESKLYELIYDEKMPPKQSLSDEEVEVLRQWIDDGAYYPDHPLIGPPPAKDDWWSLQPLVEVELPGGEDQPLDRFILKKLETEGLSPSRSASPLTLIRRVTYDLHGLPPTPREIENFLNACQQETGGADQVGDKAYSELIDRLLQSPRYGERWARHWLDIVHYGETHGFDKDQRRDNAWPYRDYVIRAFNEDKPYAEFVAEQIAGDALKPEQPDGVIATGFLAAGPWDLVGQQEVREGTIEKKRVRNLDRDDILTNVFNTFQSTTVQCARCHNHKFDPIPRVDYYRTQAVFSGIERADRDYESPQKASERRMLNDRISQTSASLEKVNNAIQDSLPQNYHDLQKDLERLGRKRGSLESKLEDNSPSNGYHGVVANTPDEHQWVEIDLGESVDLDELRLIPARPTDFKDTPGFGFPRRFTVRVFDAPETNEGEIVADYAQEAFPNPGNSAFVVQLGGKPVRKIRIDAYELWERNKDYAFALAEVEAMTEDGNVAQGKTVRASSSIDFGRWHTRFLVDGYDSRTRLETNKPENEDEIARVESEMEDIRKQSDKLLRRRAKKSALREQAELTSRLAEYRSQLGALSSPKKVYSVSSRDSRPIFDLPRGNEGTPGDQVFPAALSFISELSAKFPAAQDDEATNRRHLAEWITDNDNPLTWRTMANRIWQYHFGRGLVDTPNDFGRAGNLPTHPELLDWLAIEFRKTGSVKDLHRVILASATYRQSSQIDDTNAGIDASNRFLWRMNTRKLDAESVHDSILAISGKLDLTMGGPSYEAFNYTHDHSPKYDFLGKDSPDVWRRSVYRFIVRSVPDPLFEALDCPDPNMNTPIRNETLTAPQALAMLNDAFILTQAVYTAERLVSEYENLNDRVRALHARALGRYPEPDEIGTLSEFTEKHGLPSLARLMFNLNEFVFVD